MLLMGASFPSRLFPGFLGLFLGNSFFEWWSESSCCTSEDILGISLGGPVQYSNLSPVAKVSRKTRSGPERLLSVGMGLGCWYFLGKLETRGHGNSSVKPGSGKVMGQGDAGKKR